MGAPLISDIFEFRRRDSHSHLATARERQSSAEAQTLA
jgi:hypothetical protein